MTHNKARPLQHAGIPLAVVAGNHDGSASKSFALEREILRYRALERLLIENQVTAFISGHHHAFYPGTNNGVLHLGTGSLAGGTRQIVGTNRKPDHSFTVLRFSGNGLSVEALAAPDFSKQIDLTSLPPRLHGEYGDLIRIDISKMAGPRGRPNTMPRPRSTPSSGVSVI